MHDASNSHPGVRNRLRIGAYDAVMALDFLNPIFATAALVLAGALATFYAMRSPDNRARNAIVSIVLLSLALYRVTGGH